LSSRFATAVGLLGVGLAVACALKANGFWKQSAALGACTALPVEQAVHRLRRGTLAGPVLLEGRLGAVEPLISPGGILCAFYEAEIRTRSWLGRGMLVSQERATARALYLQGDGERVRVEISEEGLHAPETEQRVLVDKPLGLGLRPVPAEGLPVEEAVSYEKVGRLNAPCAVLGLLERDSRGDLVVRRAAGLDPLVFIGERESLKQRIGRRGARLAILAVVTTCAAGALAAL
jgi:hypothetical protein